MKFRFSENLVIDSDAEPFCREGLRIGNFGGPGSGKSFNNALLLEQFLTQGGTAVVFQPRDEYFTLKEKFDILSVGGVHAKDVNFVLTSPMTYAKAVVENGISMIFYTSDVEDEAKLVDWVARFLHAIMKLQETHHRPLLILPEESQEYLPNSTAGHIAPPWVYNRMIKAFKDCSTQGRKLNIICVVSSQRPQEVNFTIRQLCNVTFYGKFAAHDTKYLDKEVLDTVRKNGVEIRAEQLTRFGRGEWFVVLGSQSMFVTVTEKRLTKHGADTPSLEYVAPRANEVKQTVDELAKALAVALEKERAEESDLEKTKRLLRETQKKLEDAEKSAQIKLSVKEMLEQPASVHSSVDNEALEKAVADKLELNKEWNLKYSSLESKFAEQGQKLKESEEYGEKITAMEAERCDQLEGAHRKLKAFEGLRDALAAIMPRVSEEQVKRAVEVELCEVAKEMRNAAVKTESVPDGAAVVEVTESIPEIRHKIEHSIVQTNETTREGQLITLACHGFFDGKKRLTEVAKEMQRLYLFTPGNAPRDLTPLLGRLITLKILQREETPQGGWLYWLADGARDRIKEAS